MDNLRSVFAGNQPVFCSDSAEVRDLVERRGLPTVEFARLFDAPPPDVVLVVADLDTMRRHQPTLRGQALAESRVLLVPACSFDPTPEVVDYTLDLLLESDFERAVERGHRWSELLMRCPSPLRFRRPDAPDAEFACHLLGDLRLSFQREVALRPGDWRAAAGYFEVEMEVFDAKAHYFSLDGTLVVDGLLTAKGSNMPAELEHLHAEMNKLVAEIGNRPGLLTARDNRLESFVVDGAELAPEILRLSGYCYDRNFVEFSIGTNSLGDLDWSRNSVLNEGVDGIHVAVGDGINGAHVDFVSRGARLVA